MSCVYVPGLRDGTSCATKEASAEAIDARHAVGSRYKHLPNFGGREHVRAEVAGIVAIFIMF